MTSFAHVAIAQLFVDLLFKFGRLGLDLCTIGFIALRGGLKLVGSWATRRRRDLIAVLLDALCLEETPLIAGLVLEIGRLALVVYRLRGFERLEAADRRGENRQHSYGDGDSDQKGISLMRGMFGMLGVLEVLLGSVFHCHSSNPGPR